MTFQSPHLRRSDGITFSMAMLFLCVHIYPAGMASRMAQKLSAGISGSTGTLVTVWNHGSSAFRPVTMLLMVAA